MRKSKTKSLKAISSLQANKERTFRVHLRKDSLCIVFHKIHFTTRLQPLALFLIFLQISGSCSYEIVLIKKSVYVSKTPNKPRVESMSLKPDISGHEVSAISLFTRAY